MGSAEIVLLTNSERFDSKRYYVDPVVRESILVHRQIDGANPNFFHAEM